MSAEEQQAAAVDADAGRWLAPGCALAALLLGLALQVSNGFLHPAGLVLLTLALVATAGAAVVARPVALARLDGPLVRGIAAAGLVIQAGYLLHDPPGFDVRVDPEGLRWFHAGVLALAGLGAAAIAGRPRRHAWVIAAGLVIVHAALGIWVIQRSPDPAIDVHIFQKYSVAALWRGENPYALTFPDIYNNAGFYGEGLSVDGRLQFGFPYFPLSLLAAMPGQLLGHDPRYSQLLAMEATALLMAFARPGGLGLLAAALYLSTPRNFFILEQSWTEPFVVVGVAVVTFAACRRSWLTPWLFGAFVAIKQYLVFALPALILLTPRRAGVRGLTTALARGALIGTLLTVPFVLWNPAAFIKSVVTLQFYQPFRTDALSYLAWWAGQGHPQLSTAIPFLLAALAATMAVWRLPRTAAGFSAGIAVTFFVFFALNKQAFANYYFFVLGSLLMTVAACVPVAGERATEARPD